MGRAKVRPSLYGVAGSHGDSPSRLERRTNELHEDQRRHPLTDPTRRREFADTPPRGRGGFGLGRVRHRPEALEPANWHLMRVHGQFSRLLGSGCAGGDDCDVDRADGSAGPELCAKGDHDRREPSGIFPDDGRRCRRQRTAQRRSPCCKPDDPQVIAEELLEPSPGVLQNVVVDRAESPAAELGARTTRAEPGSDLRLGRLSLDDNLVDRAGELDVAATLVARSGIVYHCILPNLRS